MPDLWNDHKTGDNHQSHGSQVGNGCSSCSYLYPGRQNRRKALQRMQGSVGGTGNYSRHGSQGGNGCSSCTHLYQGRLDGRQPLFKMRLGKASTEAHLGYWSCCGEGSRNRMGVEYSGGWQLCFGKGFCAMQEL